MLILKAPYPAVRTTTVLPSPKFDDSVALKAVVKTMRAMDGTLYTHVRSSGNKKSVKWDFEISRNKALELREFIDKYNTSKIQAIDHNNVTWVGFLKNNPFEFTGAGRAGGWPGGETMTITLEFEEI